MNVEFKSPYIEAEPPHPPLFLLSLKLCEEVDSSVALELNNEVDLAVTG